MAKRSEAGMEALHCLKATEPPLWLAPSDSLSQTARIASQHLFSSLKPYVPKSPLDQLLVEGFDAEQIWQQIDIQSQPLLSSLRRQIKHFEKNPDEIRILPLEDEKVLEGENKVPEQRGVKLLREVDDDEMDLDELDDDDDDEEVGEEEGDGRESGDEERETGEERRRGGAIEDKFLKIKELEEYLEEDEAREYGLDIKTKGEQNNMNEEDGDDVEEGEEDEEEEREEEEDDELGEFGDGDDEDEGTNKLENARYEDFFGAKKKNVSTRKSKSIDWSEEESGSGNEEDYVAGHENKVGLSTHEKQLVKRRSEIEQMEKLNLEPKPWILQGEVTAANRPKNSALEVDLDFEHNARPAPVITGEVSASLEDMIRNRIIEGTFDDIQKVPSLPSKAPREIKELDENKSKKGLAEVYEEEYVQKTDPSAAPLPFSDEQKKEASALFKKLCLKLDALSHFHFAPKPVIEDMSIQSNVPALAMEEIAPMAVSDAAMLAPEEVFSGKGDIKEEAELTQVERKRRRARKKRKFRAEAAERMTKMARENTLWNNNYAKEE